MDALEDLKNISTDSILISELEKKEIEKYCRRYEMREMTKDARNEGKAIGITEEKIKIATNLLKQNIDINIISKSTGLSIKEIKKLQNK